MISLLFLLGVAVFLALPLAPSLIELLRPSDSRAMSVVQGHDGRPENFSLNFRMFALTWLQGTQAPHTAMADEILEAPVTRFSPRTVLKADPDEAFLATGAITVQKDLWLHHEIYSSTDVDCEDNVHARAILAESRLSTKTGVTILRWAHAGLAEIGDKNELLGRLTASQRIDFLNRAVFQRLNAPLISFATPAGVNERKYKPRVSRLKRMDPRDFKNIVATVEAPRRAVVNGALNFPAFSVFEGDLIVRGTLHLGEGCVIRGSIKADGSVLIGPRCRILGSVVTRESVFLGHDSTIKGLLIGERRIKLGLYSRVGSPSRPTSVTAERIDVSPGARVFGTIWARRAGRAIGAS